MGTKNKALQRTLVLVGLMGAGKSSIGRRLATRLGADFIDADVEIEQAAGCSINDIFTSQGEAAFRDGERRVIARLLTKPPHVLATGGGAFLSEETRALIRKCGFSIWLQADISVLLRRVQRRDDRPLLKDGDPKQILERLIVERYPIYAEADLIVDTTEAPHSTVVNEIVERIRSLPEAEKILGQKLLSEAGAVS
ncbi:MAG: shikimate kinase [Proteobacteria bacterium]|nr:shikimate kinase [Pseudomonadota bacterium]